MRVAVTGAGGFAGRHIAQHLRDTGHGIVAIVRKRRADTDNQLSDMDIIEADLSAGLELFPGVDMVVHCAAEIPARCPNEDQLFKSNVNATGNVFQAALHAGAKRIVFCSSMSAFGKITTDFVSPETPISHPDNYGRSKLAGEAMLDEIVSASPEVGAVSLRLPGIVGPGSHDNFLSAAMARMLSGERVEARNPDALFNNILPVRDLAVFVGHLTSCPLKDHTRLTLASEAPAPISQVLAEMQVGAATRVPVEFTTGGHTFLVSSTAAAELGYRAPQTLQAARQFGQDSRDFKGL